MVVDKEFPRGHLKHSNRTYIVKKSMDHKIISDLIIGWILLVIRSDRQTATYIVHLLQFFHC